MVTGLFHCLRAYPALYDILGSKTLPNLKGRFLEGASGTVRQFKSAGLPNITGNITSNNEYRTLFIDYAGSNGAFSWTVASKRTLDSHSSYTTDLSSLSFNASRSNAIYGNSETVQPASYTVNYLIKAY